MFRSINFYSISMNTYKYPKQYGFTLVELLIVMAILGVLATAVVKV